jgi:hypothetical protein
MEELMIFDYCEFEDVLDERSLVLIGCRFSDEPDELYVVQMDVLRSGAILNFKLLFNGMDCKYGFKPNESEAIRDYVQNVIPTSEYADWFEGTLTL